VEVKKMMKKMCLLMLLLVPMGFLFGGCEKPQALNFSTDYQVVILDNGNAYFGKLEMPGKSFIVLKDVYYIQTQINQETKAQTNILVKRGKELHAPDFMYINTQHVILIEPVTPDSQVAKLIKEDKAKSGTTTK
jgi:hypothetical protein